MSQSPDTTEVPANYCAYRDPATNIVKVGHLNLENETITPLSFLSGSEINNLYQVIEAGSGNITPSGDAFLASTVKLLPPITGRDILAVGKNYAEHAKEFNSSGFDSSDKTDQPTHPVIFTKRATSIIAHGDEILPHAEGFTETPDYEGEIGVIIGKPGFQISEEEAMDHVWGYTIINDMTARERQRDHKQFYIGKSPDTFCPMGPVAVPKEHLPGDKDMRLQTFVNGEKRQDATLDQLIFSIPRLIRDLSQAQTLQLGDTIATGTPYGVGFGFRPMKFLKPGDEVRVSVTGLGSLVNRIAPFDLANPTLQRVQSESHLTSANQRTRGGHGLITVGGKSLFYQVQGKQNASPIIFIHGLGGSSSYFAPLVSQLSDTHELHILDLEGHGLSPTHPLSSLTISSFANDLRQCYLSQSNGQPATIIAHSMGALVALNFAIGHPELVSKLILMGPPPSPLPGDYSTRTAQRANVVRSSGMASVVDAVVANGVSAHTKATNPLALTALRLSILSQDPEGYAKGCLALARSGAETLDVSKIQVPTLLLTGSEDAISSPEVCQQYAAAMSEAKVHVLPNVGHWHMFDDTWGAMDGVMSFL